MKRLLAALAVAFVLSGAAVAGEMPGVNSGINNGEHAHRRLYIDDWSHDKAGRNAWCEFRNVQ